MPRNDPTDTGGLFIGRRPGTAPVRYRAVEPSSERRRRADSLLAHGLLAIELVRDPATKEPDADTATAIVEELKREARSRGMFVLAGASSFPVLTAAAVALIAVGPAHHR